MPLPAAAAAWWLGPAAMATAKAMAVEYLPAVSSATLAALLTRLAWNRCVPEWIRKDVSFQKTFSPKRKKNKSGEEKKDDDNSDDDRSDENELERLSSVIEKIQALMVSAEQKIFGRRSSKDGPAVPFIYASLLAYIQLSAQLKRISMSESTSPSSSKEATEETEKSSSSSQPSPQQCHHSLLYQSAGRSIFEESVEDYATGTTTTTEISRLQTAMEYAIASYYVDDPDHLLELLNEKSQEEGAARLQLLQHSVNTRPGSVGHFMAICESTKTCWIGCKGTSSLEDVFTDSCGRSVSYDPYAAIETESYSRVEVCHKQHQVFVGSSTCSEACDSSSSIKDRNISQTSATVEATNASTTEIEVVCQDHDEIHVVDHGQDDVEAHIRCHEGIFIATKRLFEKVHDNIVELVVNGDYRLVMTGHSLGAGAVCLLAVMLKSRYPSLVRPLDNAVNDKNDDDDLGDKEKDQSKKKLQVYAFASPPVLDHDAAHAARSYMTCVVNHADLIPRSSLANVAVLLEFLRTISERLVTLNKAPRNVASTAAFLRMLSQGSQGEPILSALQVQEAMQAAHDKVELRHIDHLYVPGRVLLIYNQETRAMTNPEVDKPVGEVETMSTMTARKTSNENDDDSKSSASSGFSENEQEKGTDAEWCMVDADATAAMVVLEGPFCAVTEGTTPALRSFQVDGFRMLGDHTSGSYLAAINALAQKEQSVRRLYMQQRQQQGQQLSAQSENDDEEKEGLTTAAPTSPLETPCNEISDDIGVQERGEDCTSSKSSLMAAATTTAATEAPSPLVIPPINSSAST